jgi:hypothetical protein
MPSSSRVSIVPDWDSRSSAVKRRTLCGSQDAAMHNFQMQSSRKTIRQWVETVGELDMQGSFHQRVESCPPVQLFHRRWRNGREIEAIG